MNIYLPLATCIPPYGVIFSFPFFTRISSYLVFSPFLSAAMLVHDVSIYNTSLDISTFMIKQNTTEDILICAAELTTAYKVVKHHQSFSSFGLYDKIECRNVSWFKYRGKTKRQNSNVDRSELNSRVSPLAPSDYYLFPKMKKELRDKKFSTDDEVKEAVSAYFEDKNETFFLWGYK